MIRTLLALSLAFAAPIPTAAMAQGKPQPVQEGADPAIWQGEATSGPILHRETNVSLPETIGNFRRTRVGSLSSTDVFANYSHRRGAHETIVTVFLFRPGALPEHRLPVAVAAIGFRSPQAFLWSDGPFLIGSSPELRAYKATFKTGIGPDTVMDYLYFAPLGGWTVKVRATLPSTSGIEDEREIDALVRALPWSNVLAAAGSCGGWACDTASAFPINSHILEGEGIGGLLLGREAGASVYTDEGYRLIPLPIPRLAEMLGLTYGALSVAEPLFAVESGRGDERRTHRFFSGQPSEAEFRRTVSLLRDHPERPPFTPPAIVARHVPHAE